MRTITTKVYTFSELDESGRERALEWARNVDWDWYGWHDDNVQSLKEFAEWLGAKINYSIELWGGSWAKVTLPYEETEYISEIAVGIDGYNDEEVYFMLEELAGESLQDFLNNRSSIEKDCPFTGYCMDEDLLDPIRAYLKNPDDSTLQDLIDEGVNNWVKAYVADWEYSLSDEALTDTLVANEYEFTEDGKRF